MTKEFEQLVYQLMPVCVWLAREEWENGPNVGGREVIPRMAVRKAIELAQLTEAALKQMDQAPEAKKT